MRFSRFIFLMIVAIITSVILFSGCNSGGKKVVTLKLAHGLSVEHPVHKALVFMAQRAYEKSDSTLKIDIYPNEQLGNEKECIEQLQMGSLAMTKVSTSPLEVFVPKFKVLALPYLFKNDEEKWKVLNGPIGKELLAAGESEGLKGLCFFDAGARSFYTSKKPILTPADLKGLKIRTQQSPMAMEMVSALGGSPTPISWGELYTALQQGVVDGAENNPPSLFTSNHYEVCKYYSLDEHTMVPDIVLISTIVWKKLSPAHQKALQEAADETVPYQIKLWKKFVQESMDKMIAKGLKVYHPDKKLFIEKAQAMYKKYQGTEIGEMAKRIQEEQ
ncbi:MAG: TRAP transporter substrate-binding protein [Calditrichaeota bacterium]|nr:TRAP transporter substrate-binding protein [Calditrichota bacterium]